MKNENKKASWSSAVFGACLAALCCVSSAWAGVARIGGTEYDTLAAAFAAASNGDTVTLVSDATVPNEIAIDKTVTLDLATCRVTAATGANAFQVVSNGNFTVNADATNPGGITTDDDRCCVYTSWGWNPGPKTVTINNGSFDGNFVFNWASNIDPQAAAHYGVTAAGGGSGERAVPTTVVINGGVFDGGYENGNVAEYRCYYFTVNGGTFEKGLDSADTETCSIGVTSTCKAFFKGGKYKVRYPYWRETISGRESPAKIHIGDGYTDYIHIIDGDYYAIVPDATGCAVETRNAKKTDVYSTIRHLIYGVWQHWVDVQSDWYVKQSAGPSAGANNAVQTPPLHMMSAAPQLKSAAAPLASLATAAAGGEPTVYVNTDNGLVPVILQTYGAYYDAMPGDEALQNCDFNNNKFVDEKKASDLLVQSDFDVAYVFSYKTAIDLKQLIPLVDDYLRPVDDAARSQLCEMLGLPDGSSDEIIQAAIIAASDQPSPYASDPYLAWETDFVMSFDRPVAAGSVRYLWGRGSGVVDNIYANDALTAGTYKRVFDLSPLQPTWSGVVNVKKNNHIVIGLRNLSKENYGTTVTVSLRHRSPDGDDSKDVIRASYSMTFTDPSAPTAVAQVISADGATTNKYETVAAAIAAVKEGETIQLLAGTIEEGTLTLPDTIKNVTIQGAADHASILKNTTLKHDTNGLDIDGLTVSGVVFDGGRFELIEWGGTGAIKNLAFTNNIFRNLDDTTSEAAIHFNVNAGHSVNGLTLVGNVITGITGGDKSGVYGAITGNVEIRDNTISNVAFRPLCLQITDTDGIADNVVITGNTFADSSRGRVQVSANKGTDNVVLTINGNIIKGNASIQQICCWNFNDTKTTADFTGNYYDQTADKAYIYWNGLGNVYLNDTANAANLPHANSDCFNYYTELNDDGSIKESSKVNVIAATPVAQVTIGGVTTKYMDLNKALVDSKASGAVCELLSDVDLTGVAWTPVADFLGTFDGKGYTISGLTVSGASNLGLFANTGTSATIKDLTISGATVTSTSGSNHGVLAGAVSGSTISNVKVLNSTVSAAGGQYTGGLCGYGYPASCQCEIASCTVTGYDQVGGLIGYLWVGHIENCVVTNNAVTATSERAGGLVGKMQIAAGNLGASTMWLNNNVVSGTATAPDMAGGLCGQIMGDVDYYSISNNAIDVTLSAPAKNPIGNLRNGQNAAFTGALEENITGNTWTTATLDADSFQYTNVASGVESQTIWNGEKPKDYVAQVTIGGVTTPYSNLADALNATKATKGAVCTLVDDVDLTGKAWTSITGFLGVLNGNGHKIIGLSSDLLASAGINADLDDWKTVISNLTISAAQINATGDNHGILISYSDPQVYISDVTIVDSSLVADGERIGGFVGMGYPEITDCVLSNCTITGTEQVGGFQGYAAIPHIVRCTVSGTTTITATSDRAGGLIGKFQCDDHEGEPCKLNDNTVACQVNSNGGTVGGLVGQLMGDTSGYEFRRNSINVTFGGNPAPSAKNPIGNLRDGQNAIFTSVLEENITGNTWTKTTLDADSFQYTNVASGVQPQTIWNGEKPVAYVAQIGEKGYLTLEAAVDAAKSGDTITMLANSTEAQKSVVAVGKAITIDLQGFVLDGTIEYCGNLTLTNSVGTGYICKNNFWCLTGTGNLVLAADIGAKDHRTTGNGGVFATDNATVTIATDINIYVYGEGIRCDGANLTITGEPTVDSSAYGAALSINGNSTAQIAGGTYLGDFSLSGDREGPNVTVTGGKFMSYDNYNYSVCFVGSGEDLTVAISGGIYSDDSAKEYLADGYEVVDNGDPLTFADYPWIVRKIEVVVPEIDETTTVDVVVVKDEETVVDKKDVNVEEPEEQKIGQKEYRDKVNETVHELNENTEVTKVDTGIVELNESRQEAGETTISNIVVTLTAIKIDDTTVMETSVKTCTSATFDVKPVDESGNKVELAANEIVTFRLPIASNVVDTAVEIFHRADNEANFSSIGYYAIQGEGTGKYVELSAHDFSFYMYNTAQTTAYQVSVAGTEQKIAVSVFDTWWDGRSGVETEEQKSAYLAVVEANGFQRWQNYVSGVDGTVATKKLTPICDAAAPGSAVVTVRAEYLGTPTPDSGVTPSYALLKKNGTGNWVEVESADAPVFAVDTSALDATTSWRIRANFTPVK